MPERGGGAVRFGAMLVSFAGRCLGARALCSVSPARVAGSSLTCAERSAYKAYSAREICAGSYQNVSEMMKRMVWKFAAGMKALEGMLK